MWFASFSGDDRITRPQYGQRSGAIASAYVSVKMLVPKSTVNVSELARVSGLP